VGPADSRRACRAADDGPSGLRRGHSLRTDSMAEYSKFQQKVIKNYYENRDTLALQRVQELVTELYLSEGKKRIKHWDSLALHLGKLGVKPDVVAHLRQQDKPELVATLVKKLIEKN
jgi:hypothetical protein